MPARRQEIATPPPEDFQLRPLQKEILEDANRFKVACIHRRFGKTVLAVEYLVDGWEQCDYSLYRGYFVFPFASQGMQVAWEFIKTQTAHIEGMHYDKADLAATFPDGGQIRLLGAEQYNRHRGKYADRVVFDEVSDIAPAAWRQVFRPMLSDRLGGALFIGTPRGHDWFHDLYLNHNSLDGWAGWHKTVYETGAIKPDEIEALRRELLPDEFKREYLCDWDVAAHGAFYQDEINALLQGGRGGEVPMIDAPVHTSWWLDNSDQITVTLWQQAKKRYRCIGALHEMNASIAALTDQLDSLQYDWGKHHAPIELDTGSHRYLTSRRYGYKLRPNPVPVELMDRIELVKTRLPFTSMDGVNAANLIEAGRQYRAEFDEKKQILKPGHLENLSARFCQSMAVFFMGHNERASDWSKPIAYPEKWRA